MGVKRFEQILKSGRAIRSLLFILDLHKSSYIIIEAIRAIGYHQISFYHLPQKHG